MAGLFTLDSEFLGVLDSNALGGFGTGFVVGAQSQSGSVSGAVGYAGSASGSVSVAGSVSGSVGFAGSVSGSQISAGSVTGRENNVGSVAGSVVSSGSVAGTVDALGTVSGVSVSAGSFTGSPSLNGSVAGSSASTGTVSGSAPGPTPTPQPTESGGARWWYWPAPKIVRSGKTVSRRGRGSGIVSGAVSVSGRVEGLQAANAVVAGLAKIILPVFIPSANSARVRRKRADDELVSLWVD